MVLSLAFVLAFIIAAVSLLLGFLIVGDVTDFVQIEEVLVSEEITINGTWQYRELQPTGSAARFFWFASNLINSQSTIGGSVAESLNFKSFPTSFLQNTDIIIDWAASEDDVQALQPGTFIQLRVVDGEFHRSNLVTFPTGNIGNQDHLDWPLPLSSWSYNATTEIQLNDGGIPRQFTTLNYNPPPGSGETSTIFAIGHDHAVSFEVRFFVYSINITDATTGATKAFFDFTSGSTYTCELGFSGCSEPAITEYGTIHIDNFVPLVAQPAVFDTQASDVLESSKDTIWTVLAIFPIALFFVLFALFSSFGSRS